MSIHACCVRTFVSRAERALSCVIQLSLLVPYHLGLTPVVLEDIYPMVVTTYTRLPHHIPLYVRGCFVYQCVQYIQSICIRYLYYIIILSQTIPNKHSRNTLAPAILSAIVNAMLHKDFICLQNSFYTPELQVFSIIAMFTLKRKGETLTHCKFLLLLGIGRKDRIIIKNCHKKQTQILSNLFSISLVCDPYFYFNYCLFTCV